VALDTATNTYRLFATYVNRQKPPEFYAHLLAGQIQDEEGEVVTYDWGPHLIYDTYAFMDLCADVSAAGDLTEIHGDPHGGSRHSGVDSWYDNFEKTYWRLTGKRAKVRKKWDTDSRYHQGRQNALTNLLPFLFFHDSPQVRRTVEALKRYKIEEPDKPRKGEKLLPEHTWISHIVTAMEYGAANLRAVEASRKRDRRAYDSKTGERINVYGDKDLTYGTITPGVAGHLPAPSAPHVTDARVYARA
jgi:hypothetical protein